MPASKVTDDDLKQQKLTLAQEWVKHAALQKSKNEALKLENDQFAVALAAQDKLNGMQRQKSLDDIKADIAEK